MGLSALPGQRLGTCPEPVTRCLEPTMQDLVFVIVTIAFFALSALVVKGVERL
jgi:hypothetical protein